MYNTFIKPAGKIIKYLFRDYRKKIPLDEKGCKYLTAEDQTCGVHNERAIMCGLFPVYLNPVFWKQRRTHMDSLGASVMPEMPRRYTGKMKILVHKCTRKNHPGGVSTQLTETNLDNAIRLASRVIISSPEYISATKHFAVNFEGFFPRRNYVVKHSNPI